MSLSMKQSALTFTLTILTLWSGWLIYKNIFNPETLSQPSNSTPTAILEGVSTINFDTDGEIKNLMKASQLVYYATIHKSEFTNPLLVFYQPGKKPWNITADRGISTDNNKKVQLYNNIKIQQDLGKNNPANLILTSELTILPHENYAETNQSVDFTQLSQDKSKISMKSQGAIVNQKTGEIHLSKIRGSYEEAH